MLGQGYIPGTYPACPLRTTTVADVYELLSFGQGNDQSVAIEGAKKELHSKQPKSKRPQVKTSPKISESSP